MLAPSGAGDPRLKERSTGRAVIRSRGGARARAAFVAILAMALGGCLPDVQPTTGARPVRRPTPAPVAARAPAPTTTSLDDQVAARLRAGIEYGPWHEAGGWVRYMVPTTRFVDADGGVDVAFQFHGAEVAEKDWRQSGLDALILSITFPGWGSVPYKEGFSDPSRFGAIVDDTLRKVGATHIRRLLLVSWSAGYAAMGLVLNNAYYYALTDTVVILDGLHADLIDGKPDERAIAVFERFAHDAVAGKKTMIVAHSSIVPPGYASTTQMAELLCASAGARRVEGERRSRDGTVEYYRADAGALHVRGFRGLGPKDHLDQLHLLDDLVVEYVTPRWTRLALGGD